jgi:2'-5' RNA ligase
MSRPAHDHLFFATFVPPDADLALRSATDFHDFTDRLIEPDRRHVTLLALGPPTSRLDRTIRQATDLLTDSLRRFRVVFDRLVIRSDRSLVVPAEPLLGVETCQERLLAALTASGLRLPKTHASKPHVTLGYRGGVERAVAPIDPVSWWAEEVALVRSLHGEHKHELVERWPLAE